MTKIYLAAFEPGQIVSTPGALQTLNQDDVRKCLGRHLTCDWGGCCEEDREENDLALKKGFRLFSIYWDRNGTKFWIITEGDRSATTILLPEEY